MISLFKQVMVARVPAANGTQGFPSSNPSHLRSSVNAQAAEGVCFDWQGLHTKQIPMTDPWDWYMGVSKNNGTPKSSILIRFSIINHPFWGTPIFGNIHIYLHLPNESTKCNIPVPWILRDTNQKRGDVIATILWSKLYSNSPPNKNVSFRGEIINWIYKPSTLIVAWTSFVTLETGTVFGGSYMFYCTCILGKLKKKEHPYPHIYRKSTCTNYGNCGTPKDRSATIPHSQFHFPIKKAAICPKELVSWMLWKSSVTAVQVGSVSHDWYIIYIYIINIIYIYTLYFFGEYPPPSKGHHEDDCIFSRWCRKNTFICQNCILDGSMLDFRECMWNKNPQKLPNVYIFLHIHSYDKQVSENLDLLICLFDACEKVFQMVVFHGNLPWHNQSVERSP